MYVQLFHSDAVSGYQGKRDEGNNLKSRQSEGCKQEGTLNKTLSSKHCKNI